MRKNNYFTSRYLCTEAVRNYRKVSEIEQQFEVYEYTRAMGWLWTMAVTDRYYKIHVSCRLEWTLIFGDPDDPKS